MAIFNLEFLKNLFLLEASKEDAQRAIKSGERIHTLRKGARIESSDRLKGKKYCGIDEKIYPFPKKPGEKQSETYKKEYSLNKEKMNSNNKQKSNKEKIRDASRSIEGNVPEYGADPTKSRDADLKAVRKFYQSKKYKDIDIEKTIENMPKEKAIIVKRTLERGGKLPQSISSKLIKKSNTNEISNDRKSNSFYSHQFSSKDDPTYKKIKSIFNKLETTKDYGEYKKLYSEFERLTGIKADAIQNIVFQQGKLEFYPKKSKNNDNIDKDDNLYHNSPSQNIKNLTPTFRSNDGTYYKTPRIYFYKNKKGDKTGGTGTDQNSTNYKINNIKKAKKDPELGGKARYITTHKEIPVTKEK